MMLCCDLKCLSRRLRPWVRRLFASVARGYYSVSRIEWYKVTHMEVIHPGQVTKQVAADELAQLLGFGKLFYLAEIFQGGARDAHAQSAQRALQILKLCL